MRVAIFFDGKNFYSGWRANANRFRVESFSRLAQWLVEQTKGSYLAGAYYYTGIETGAQDATQAEGQRRLGGFLDMLETQPGFFVFRFPRKARQSHCQSCGAVTKFTTEKEVDTTLVADMLRLAAVNAFDVAVVVSGDADLAPAVEGVRGLGKQVYVATWGGSGLAPRVRKAAFDHIDLLQGVAAFASPGAAVTYAAPDSSADAVDDVFAAELALAQEHFTGGYVGVNYFITKWRSDRLSDKPALRQRVLDRLIEADRVEIYLAGTGDRAIRLVSPEAPTQEFAESAATTPVEAAIEEASAQLAAALPAPPQGEEGMAPASVAAAPRRSEAELEGCFSAIKDAEQHFRAGYVGYNYFLTKWRSTHITDDPEERERLVQELVAAGRVEVYQAADARAVRTTDT